MKLKICGMMGLEDIALVNRYQPDYIGFIFVPGKRRTVSAELAAQMKRQLDPKIKAVGVWMDPNPDAVGEIAAAGIVDLIQLHGKETPAFAAAIKAQTGLPVIKALTRWDADTLAEWENSAVDYLLFDSGTGSGETFDWNRLPQSLCKPCFLAGGISPENIRQAIKCTNLYGIDCSSGVEKDGRKNEEKIKDLIFGMREKEE